jgi:hypothetical protein
MEKPTFVTIAVASLMLATATVRAESPTYLYGTTSTNTSGLASIATTTPTSSDPRAAYVVAAETNKSGALKVIAWQDTTTSLVQIGHASGGGLAVRSVAATGLDATRVVTADVDETGALSINTWAIGGSTGVTKQNGYSTGPKTATAVSIATVSSTQVVTATEDFSGNLAVEEWTISAGGLPTPIGVVEYDGPANQVAIATISSDQVITVVGTTSNTLIVTTWAVDSAGVQYQNDYVMKNAVSSFSGDVAIGAGSQLAFETVDGLPTLQTVRTAFTPIINVAANVEVLYWNISASGNISLLSKAETTKGDFFQVAGCMLPTDVPITAFGDVFSDVHVGWYGNGTDAVYNAIKGNTNGITSIGATAAGSDYKVFLPVYNAYLVTGVLTYTGSPTDGDLQIRVWSYPVVASDL